MNFNLVQPLWCEWVKMTPTVSSCWKISGRGHWRILLTPTLAKVRVGVRVGSKAMRRTMKKFSTVACSYLCSNWALNSQRSRPQRIILWKYSLCKWSWKPPSYGSDSADSHSADPYEWLSPVFVLSLHSESRSLSIKVIGKEIYINLCLDPNLILLNKRSLSSL